MSLSVRTAAKRKAVTKQIDTKREYLLFPYPRAILRRRSVLLSRPAPPFGLRPAAPPFGLRPLPLSRSLHEKGPAHGFSHLSRYCRSPPWSAGTRSGTAFGHSEQLLCQTSSPPRGKQLLDAKTPSPRAEGQPAQHVEEDDEHMEQEEDEEDEEEEEFVPPKWGGIYTHKCALDFIIEKEYIAFDGQGLTAELEAMRDQIIAGAYAADPAKVLADAEALLRSCVEDPEKHPAAGLFSPGNIAGKLERTADLCAGAVEKVQKRRWKADPTVVDTLAIVTTDGAPYMLCSDAQNVLWKRSFAGDDLSWTEMSGVPTGPIALCAGGSALYIIDEYNCIWSRELGTGEDAPWVLLERSNTGKDLTALAVLDGTLYASTEGDKMLTRKTSAPVTIDGSGWQELRDAAGKPVDAFDVRSMAALDGKLYAVNNSDELWELELGSKMTWHESSEVLPGSYGLCVHKTGSDITMFTANWDSIWQRPCGKENEEKCKPTLLHGRVSAASVASIRSAIGAACCLLCIL